MVASGIDSKETAPAGITVHAIPLHASVLPRQLRGGARRSEADQHRRHHDLFLLPPESADMAQPYGEEIAKAMTFFTGLYGSPLKTDLTVVETEDGTPNGYSAPGLLFLSPHGIGKQVNRQLVANQVSRQWWGRLVSPTTRNHTWIENGLARYSEILYTEHVNGAGAYGHARFTTPTSKR